MWPLLHALTSVLKHSSHGRQWTHKLLTAALIQFSQTCPIGASWLLRFQQIVWLDFQCEVRLPGYPNLESGARKSSRALIARLRAEIKLLRTFGCSYLRRSRGLVITSAAFVDLVGVFVDCVGFAISDFGEVDPWGSRASSVTVGPEADGVPYKHEHNEVWRNEETHWICTFDTWAMRRFSCQFICLLTADLA